MTPRLLLNSTKPIYYTRMLNSRATRVVGRRPMVEPVLSQFGLVVGLHLVHLSLNQRSDIFCNFMLGQNMLATYILGQKHILHILKIKWGLGIYLDKDACKKCKLMIFWSSWRLKMIVSEPQQCLHLQAILFLLSYIYLLFILFTKIMCLLEILLILVGKGWYWRVKHLNLNLCQITSNSTSTSTSMFTR